MVWTTLAVSGLLALPSAGSVEVVWPEREPVVETRPASGENAAWVNVVYGAGNPREQRSPGSWLHEHWTSVDAVDRGPRLGTHGWLERRGIRSTGPTRQEYQETIHLHERVARRLLERNGLARDWRGAPVLSSYNRSNPRWSKTRAWDAWIVDPSSPQWNAVLGYEWASAPLGGDFISQDNIGGALTRLGPGAAGRFGPVAERALRERLRREGLLGGLIGPDESLQDYMKRALGGPLKRLPPLAARVDRQAAHALLEDPVYAALVRSRALDQLSALRGLAATADRVARRHGRELWVHGNLGGLPGFLPFPMLAADLVDTVWFESRGVTAYDVFEHGWLNSWGTLRLQIAEAAGRGERPCWFLTLLRRHTPDLLAHELGEVSAGGCVPVLHPHSELEPEVAREIDVFLGFRDLHRSIFELPARSRYAQVALVYPLETLLYDQAIPNFESPAVRDLAGAAHALETAHVPYRVVIADHAALRPDRFDPAVLREHAVVVLAGAEALSERHVSVLVDYLQSGGTLVVVGPVGTRDEGYRRRDEDVTARLRAAGRVLFPLDTERFGPSRAAPTAEQRGRMARMGQAVRGALDQPLIEDPLPETLRVKTWLHADGFATVHFVNQDFDGEAGRARPTQPLSLRVALPAGLEITQATWLVPGEAARLLELTRQGRRWHVTLPGFDVHGVLVLGPAGREEAESLRRRGDRLLARARLAGANVDLSKLRRNAAAYSRAAERALVDAEADADLARREQLAEWARWDGAVLALDAGNERRVPGWVPLRADHFYSSERGYGWLDPDDDSAPTPEEDGYTYTFSEAAPTNVVREDWLPLWTGPRSSPPLHRVVYSGRAQRLRLDLPDGDYRIELIQAHPSGGLSSFDVSGLVRVDGACVLLDTPLRVGELVKRTLWTRARDGHVELGLGGATGFGLAALMVFREAGAGPEGPASVGVPLRTWQLSGRYANPDWFALERVRAPPDAGLARTRSAAESGWSERSAPERGLPVVDLGTLEQAAIGDVVYARAVIESPAPGRAALDFGATSWAEAWWNGERVAAIDHLKGIELGEGRADVDVRAGENVLVLKLMRFWERRWLYYARLDALPRAAHDAR